MKSIKDVLAEDSSSTEEYGIKRMFYGFLRQCEELEGVYVEDFYVQPFDGDENRGRYSTAEDTKNINYDVFNDVHKELPELRVTDKSLFNLLDEDIHLPNEE